MATRNDTAERLAWLGKVAEALGPDWSAREQGAGHILTDGTVELFAYSQWNAPDRVEFSGSWPEGSHDLIRYDETERSLKTSAATERDPAAVARQIETKLLPTVRELTATLRERIDAHRDAFKARAKLASAIELAMPGSRFDNDNRVRLSLPDGYGDVRINHDAQSGSVELHGVTADQILSILRLVK